MRSVAPFLAAAGAYFLLYRVYQVWFPATDRNSVSLDPGPLLETVWTLIRNGVIPALVFDETHVGIPQDQFLPSADGSIDMLWFAHTADGTWMALVALMTVGLGLAFVACRRPIPGRVALGVGTAFAAAALIPIAVLGTSRLYQETVTAGYLAGHMATNYLAIGLAGGLACVTLWGIGRVGGQSRVALAVLLASGWAFLSGLTLSYNVQVREYMDANAQKWQAFALLVDSLPADEGAVVAPAFFGAMGVSAIPGPAFFERSYWSAVAREEYGRQLDVLPEADATRQTPFAAYFIEPGGNPIVFVAPVGAPGEPRRLTLFARKATGGTLSWTRDDGKPVSSPVSLDRCASVCSGDLVEPGLEFDNLRFTPARQPNPSFLHRLWSSRGPDFAVVPR
jgi:hypothetical protein